MANVTQLLNAATGGDREASAQMFGLLYADLKRMARNSLRGNGGVPELNTTASTSMACR